MEKVIKAYKGFDSDLKCMGFQFEDGKEYEHYGKVKACESGFHACEAPLDVLAYYPPVNDNGKLNTFREVECSGEVDSSGDDSKLACSKIKIGAAINFMGLAKAHIEYVKTKIDKSKEQTIVNNTASNTGNYSAASNTGYCSAASNTGYRSAASNTGNCSAASNTGNYSAASNTGYRSAASNTGYRSAASNTGNCSAASNTGNYSAASNTGNCSAASNTGNYSAASNTGDRSAASNMGKDSVALAWGIESSAKAAKGSYIALAEWVEKNGEWVLKSAKMAKVDGVKIKADTYYALKDGKFVEAENEQST